MAERPPPGREIAAPETAETDLSRLNRSQFVPVLKSPEFMLFSVSQAVSLFGDKLDYMALLAMIGFFADKYGWVSARALSFLSVVIALPTILFGPLAGVLVDRWDRRKVMVACDSARAVLVFAVPLVALATSNLPLVYAIAFCVFLCGLFYNTARLSIIPNLVGSDRLLGANSFMNVVGRVATLAGVLLGGLIVDWQWWRNLGIDPVWSAGFYIDGLTYVFSVVALVVVFTRLRGRWHQSGRARREPVEVRVLIGQPARMLASVREALQFVRREPAVLFVYASVLTFVILGATILVLYVPIIQGSGAAAGIGGLGLGTRGVGFVAAIGSVGLVLSALGYGVIGHRVKKHIVMLACFFVLGAAAAGMAVSRSFALLAPLAFVAGLALSPIYIGMDTLLHECVPESARGRVFSAREWLLHVTFAVAALGIGQLSRLFDHRHMVLAVGLLVVAASVVGFLLTRRHRLN